MTFSETLIAVTLSAIITTGTALVFASYARSTSMLETNGRTATKILKTDEKLRNEISSVQLPFHLSSTKEAEKAAEFLKDKYALTEEIKILSVTLLKDSAGIARGLDVLWEKDGTECRTKELFDAIPVLK